MSSGGVGVLVAGAINTDLVARVRHAPEAGETITGLEFNIFGGGKGANQTLSAVRSGVPTAILGALGHDDFGAARLADLRADSVDVESVAVLDGVASGVALITVEIGGQNRIAYVPGATMKVTVDQARAALRRVRPSIVLSTLELPHDALKALFTDARAIGATVVLNATPEPSEGKDLASLVDVLIVNETEAKELLGGEEGNDWDAVAARLQALGPDSVIITLGKDGALGRFGAETVKAAAPEMEAIDSTGAGDAFCGAFAARLAEGSTPEAALHAAVAAGSLSVTVHGAQRSMPTRAAIDALLAGVG
jgi:ribokinase